MPLTFRTFTPEDNHDYAQWFSDPDLQRHLGPAWTAEELREVLAEASGCEWAVTRDGELVAVVGVAFPDDDHLVYAITGLAVRPRLRDTGIGREALAGVMKQYQLKDDQRWVAFVDDENAGAKEFFEYIGWTCLTERPDDAGMHTFSRVDCTVR